MKLKLPSENGVQVQQPHAYSCWAALRRYHESKVEHDAWCTLAYQVVENLWRGPSTIAAGYELLQDALDASDIPLDLFL